MAARWCSGRLSVAAYQRLNAIIALTMSNIKTAHVKKTGGPSGIT